MPDFKISILGGTGGPFEDSTQCFMIRPVRKEDSLDSICIDGGVGLGSIARMLQCNPETRTVDDFYREETATGQPVEKYIDEKLLPNVVKGFTKTIHNSLDGNIAQKAMKIYQHIGEYYITHPHMDHIAGMIINSPVIFEPAVLSKKQIFGLPFTIESMEKYIFNDIIWPQLSSKLLGRLELKSLLNQEPHTSETIPEWDIIPFEVYHGSKVSDKNIDVSSSVYVITNNITKNTILVCGDLETDHTGPNERKLLDQVWTYLAENVKLENLKAVIIECSNSASVDERRLFGHLSSNKLLDELQILRNKYNSPQGLSNLNVIISHVKMVYEDKDPRLVILEELRTLGNKTSGLEKITFSVAVQGYTFTI